MLKQHYMLVPWQMNIMHIDNHKTVSHKAVMKLAWPVTVQSIVKKLNMTASPVRPVHLYKKTWLTTDHTSMTVRSGNFKLSIQAPGLHPKINWPFFFYLYLCKKSSVVLFLLAHWGENSDGWTVGGVRCAGQMLLVPLSCVCESRCL